MKKCSFLFVSLLGLLVSKPAMCQLVTDDIFLQGHWLEVCVAPNGSWGNTVTPPAVYHTTSGGSTYSYTDPITGTTASTTTTMDFQYDAHHDGWTVAAPGSVNYYGPYFLPGTPFDGWSMQVNGKLGQAFYTTGGTGFAALGGAKFGGTNSSYATSLSTGGCLTPNTKVGYWTGYFVPEGTDTVKIYQENRVDTDASWDVVTVKFVNTSATNMTGLYYFVSADPDNDELTTGGSFPTNNHIQYQNDARHRVMVEARPPTIHQDAYSSLCTRDCRAKAMIYISWPPSLSTGNDLDLVWSGGATGMSTCYYTLGQWTWDEDIAYALVYNLGNLPAGDSTIISFAWNFKDSTCVDSAFPDPVLVLNGTQVPSGDTFNNCGATTLPVCIGYGAEKDWTWSNWTWSPATGLSSTTGVSNIVDLTALTGPVTYTVTGNDSVSGMHSCNTYVLYLTVSPCFGANANSPCIGNTLNLNAIGDSAGATYQWLDPAGTTYSTLHHVYITPSVWSDTGTWMVIRTVGTQIDTARVHVTINPLPVFALSCNGDSLCSSLSTTLTDTMKLYCVPGVAGDSYAWTGPGGFTSTSEFPWMTPYLPADTGWYHITVTDANGCSDTGSVFARIIPPLPPPVITGVHHYCTGNTFVPLGITLISGANAYWYTDSVGGTPSTVAPVVDLSYAHTVVVWASQYEGVCEGLRSSFTIVVDSTPAAPVVTSNTPICADSTLQLFAMDGLDSGSYSWTGPAGFTSVSQTPVILNAQVGNSGTYVVVYTMPTSCHATGNTTVVVNPTPAPPVVTADSPCDGFTLNLFATDVAGCVFAWNGPDAFTAAGANPAISPAKYGVNDGIYTVVATLGACPSLPGMGIAKIFPNPPAPITYDTAFCQFTPSMPLRADSLIDSVTGIYNYLTWYTTSGGSGTVSEPYYPSTQNPGTFTWFVKQTTDHGCVSPRAPENIHVLDSPSFNIVASSPYACQDSSVWLNYSGLGYAGLTYEWTKPVGSFFVDGSPTSPSVKIQFDSIYHDSLSLFVWDHNWNITCHSNQMISIRVVKQPNAEGYIKQVVCQGDTVTVELTNRSDNAYSFAWDFQLSGFDGVVWSSSGSTGPYGVQWVTPGTKDVTIIPYTVEGCRGNEVHDTVVVRPLPSASFNHGQGGKVCADDSVLFLADMGDSTGYKYSWTPSHFFNENGSGSIWGRVEISGFVTLTVTDPYNCTNSQSIWFDTDPACCLVTFPSAFSPNGDGKNDFFRPIFNGYHNFHIFRIQNRWGQTVFETTNSDGKWDGNYGGAPQDMDVYYYYLKYDCNGRTIEKHGDVTLVR